MEMKDPIPAFTNASFNVGFFNIHVESIQQQTKIIRFDEFDQIESLCGRVDERGFITIDWLEGKTNPLRMGGLAAFDQGFDDPFHGLFGVNALFDDAPDQAQDDDRAEAGCAWDMTS